MPEKAGIIPKPGQLRVDVVFPFKSNVQRIGIVASPFFALGYEKCTRRRDVSDPVEIAGAVLPCLYIGTSVLARLAFFDYIHATVNETNIVVFQLGRLEQDEYGTHDAERRRKSPPSLPAVGRQQEAVAS
ncbi:hypothetical protein [Burkholderia gladioli]|uniref:hypothetical protein n=1 Tax=Burkholderia gladioli TaxID=28095 RepID=UPI001FC7C077|nr:hypothetical protein [Burkholderia gladioli]